MPKNFKSRQLEAARLVVSGSDEELVPAQFLIVSASDVDSDGRLTATFKTNTSVGPDVFLYVTGSKQGKHRYLGGDLSAVGSVSVFGGDLVVSGTLYAEKTIVQVNEDFTGSLHISGNLEVDGTSVFGRPGNDTGFDATFYGGTVKIVKDSQDVTPHLLLHEVEAASGGRISFTNTADTTGPFGNSHEFTIYAKPAAQGSPGSADLFIFYGDADGDGTGQNIFTIQGDKKVGIMDTSPSFTLDVNGDGRLTQQLNVGGNTSVTGTLSVGISAAGSNVTFYGGVANAVGLQWDEDGGDGGGELTLGQDDYGVDLRAYGDTASRYIDWTSTNDRLTVYGDFHHNYGKAWFSQQLGVRDRLSVTGSIFTQEQINVAGNASVTGSIFAGDDVALDQGKYLYFDGMGGDVFIFAHTTYAMTIDADAYLYVDAAIEQHYRINGTPVLEMYNSRVEITGSTTITEQINVAGNASVTGTLAVGTSGNGSNVTFYGGVANAVGLQWDEDGGDGGGMLDLGTDDYGVDFRAYGATASRYVHWNSINDQFRVFGFFQHNYGRVEFGQQVGIGDRLSVTGSIFTQEQINVAGNASVTGSIAVGTATMLSGGLFLKAATEPKVQATNESVLWSNAGNLYWKNAGGSAQQVGSGGGGAPGVGWHSGSDGGAYHADHEANWISTSGSLAITGSVVVGTSAAGADATFYGDTGRTLHWDADDNTYGTLKLGTSAGGATFEAYGPVDGDKYLSWGNFLGADTLHLKGVLNQGEGDVTFGFDGEDSDFRVRGGAEMMGMIVSDAGTTQFLLHSSGSTAASAGGTGIPAGSDVATYISGAVGSRGVLGSKGTTLVTGDMAVSGNVTAGTPGNGSDVTFYGGDASAVGMVWDEDGGDSERGSLTLGTSGNGVDFTAYGITAGRYVYWEETSNSLWIDGNLRHTNGKVIFSQQLNITDRLSVTGSIFTQQQINVAGNASVTGTLAVGTSGNGSNVTFYGGDAGALGMVWVEDGGTNNRGLLRIGLSAGVGGGDLQVYGDTASRYVAWNAATDSLSVQGTFIQNVGSATFKQQLGVADRLSVTGSVFAAAQLNVAGRTSITGSFIQINGRGGFGTSTPDSEVEISSAGSATLLLTSHVTETSSSIAFRTDDTAATKAALTFVTADNEIVLVNSVSAGATVFKNNGDGPTYTEMMRFEPGAEQAGAQVLIMSGGAKSSPSAANFTDANFFVSGTIGSRGSSNLGSAVFGGDAVVSGAFYLSQLSSTPGTPTTDSVVLYAKDSAGTSRLFYKDDSGAETEVGSGGGGTNYFTSPANEIINTTGSVGIDDQLNVVGNASITGSVAVQSSTMLSGALFLKSISEPGVQQYNESVLYSTSGRLYWKEAGGVAHHVQVSTGSSGWTSPAKDLMTATGSINVGQQLNVVGNTSVSGAFYLSQQVSSPGTPPTDSVVLYAKDDSGTSKLFYKDDAGSEILISGGGSGGSGDADATFVVLSATGSLNNERVLTAGTGISLVDGGSGNPVTLSIRDSVFAALTGSQFSGQVGFQVNASITGSLSVVGTSTFTDTITSYNILPAADNTYDLGSADNRWANVYTGDLHLRNDRGNWTIQEDADKLIVVNNLTGKRYKMALEPLGDDE